MHFPVVISIIIILAIVASLLGSVSISPNEISLEPTTKNLVISTVSQPSSTVDVRGPYTIESALENEPHLIRLPNSALNTLHAHYGDYIYIGEGRYQLEQVVNNENDLIRCNTITAPSPRKKIDKLTKTTPDTKTVFELISLFRNDGTLHRSTGGTHRCIIYLCGDTPVHCSFEDISRHNAVDKAVGHAVVKGYDLSHCILFTSGRVPVDMAEKVIAAKIPVLISKSVPTAASVKLAKEYGLTLICKAWQDSFELFS
jgi:formate dehydrogenase accessory protein FdhD